MVVSEEREPAPQPQETLTMKSLLEAGVHFGHQTQRWHPRMKQFIFAQRNGIHIIDLQQTMYLLDRARQFISNVVAGGDSVLFVGTKRQAQDSIELAAKRCEMFYVKHRWLGGMLTNFPTIQGRIDHLVPLGRAAGAWWVRSSHQEGRPEAGGRDRAVEQELRRRQGNDSTARCAFRGGHRQGEDSRGGGPSDGHSP